MIQFPDTLIRPEPERLSFSSLSSYVECGERWRFDRLFEVRTSTWFATVAGSAIHEITEAIDRGLPEEPFKDVFDRLLAVERENGIEVKPSGKVLKNVGPTGGPNKKDYDWYLHYGPLFITSYAEWRDANPHLVIATLPDGSPAIEVSLTADIGGDTFRGYIDRVFLDTSSMTYILVDLKTGNDPSSNLQLGAYRVGLLREYGIEAAQGGFWSAPKGTLGYLVDLSVYSESYIDAQFEMAWRGIRASVFLANPGNFCNACDAKPYCRAVGGRDAVLFPVRTELVKVAQVSPESVATSADGV